MGGEPCLSQLLPLFIAYLAMYMRPNVVVKDVDRTTSLPFFSNSFRQFLCLIGVNVAGDCVPLREQLGSQKHNESDGLV